MKKKKQVPDLRTFPSSLTETFQEADFQVCPIWSPGFGIGVPNGKNQLAAWFPSHVEPRHSRSERIARRYGTHLNVGNPFLSFRKIQ